MAGTITGFLSLAPTTRESTGWSGKSSNRSGIASMADRHVDFFRQQREEIERLRRLIDARTDFHLNNWSVWRRKDVVTVGYADHVPGLDKGIGRCVAGDASDHDYEAHDAYAAEVCDTIIDELPQLHRIAISNVYEASVWQFRSTAMLEKALIDGAQAFWRDAVRRGLA